MNNNERVLIIDACRQCIYKCVGTYDGELYCRNPSFANYRPIKNIDIIPKWCPLEKHKK